MKNTENLSTACNRVHLYMLLCYLSPPPSTVTPSDTPDPALDPCPTETTSMKFTHIPH